MSEFFFKLVLAVIGFIFSPVSRTEIISVTCQRSGGPELGDQALSLYIGITISDMPFV